MLILTFIQIIQFTYSTKYSDKTIYTLVWVYNRNLFLTVSFLQVSDRQSYLVVSLVLCLCLGLLLCLQCCCSSSPNTNTSVAALPKSNHYPSPKRCVAHKCSTYHWTSFYLMLSLWSCHNLWGTINHPLVVAKIPTFTNVIPIGVFFFFFLSDASPPMMTWAWSVGSPVHWFVPSRSTWPLAKVKKQKPTPPFIKMNFLLCLSSPFVSPCVLVIIITKTTDTTVFLSQRPFYQSYSSLLRSRWIRTPETLTPEHITVHSCLFFQNCLFLPWSLPLPFMLNGWHPRSRRLKRYCQWLMQAKNKHETSNSLCCPLSN